jgi:hypothetical protein
MLHRLHGNFYVKPITNKSIVDANADAMSHLGSIGKTKSRAVPFSTDRSHIATIYTHIAPTNSHVM